MMIEFKRSLSVHNRRKREEERLGGGEDAGGIATASVGRKQLGRL